MIGVSSSIFPSNWERKPCLNKSACSGRNGKCSGQTFQWNGPTSTTRRVICWMVCMQKSTRSNSKA
eukprot:12931678-Prorocentrum_lima.AAC.1